jgi:tRNA(adenine34) deaminase
MNKALEKAASALKLDEFPVGCVITDGIEIMAQGARLGTANGGFNELDHAEMVALRQLDDDTIIKTQDFSQLTLYSTLEPCLMCLGAIIIRGIGRVVYACEDVMGGGTQMIWHCMSPLYRDCQIEIIPYVLRKESLTLFQKFFKRPDNHYWRGSLLANYMLHQAQ